MKRLGGLELAAYGALGFPLAMAALPIYVHLPKFYGDDLGLPLALVGAILLGTRLADAVSDPLLGYFADRVSRREIFVLAALPLLALGMIGLFHPPADRSMLAVWLAGLLVVVYLGFSMASISYQAWGAQLSGDLHERTRITAAREIFTLVGVVLAAALPQVLGTAEKPDLALFSWVFAALLAVFGGFTLAAAPRPPAKPAARTGILAAIASPLANRDFRWLLVVFVLSGVAAAIPSTLVLFFIADVLQANDKTALFLVIYFLSGAAGIPVWVWLAKRIGKKNAWIAGMLVAIVAFVWAFGLGAGDVVAYGVICAMSGLALGADLALPPSILADVIDRDRRSSAEAAEGSYFGLWNLVTKANLALAAGIALPVLSALGYQPGVAAEGRSLPLVYALLPCAFKLASAAVLWLAPLERAPARLDLQGERT